MASPPVPTSLPTYAAGQVLVGLRSGTQLSTLSELPGVLDARPLLPDLYLLSVPEGQEMAIVKTLASRPDVAYASLNYLIAEPPLAPSQMVTLDDEPAWGRPHPAQVSSCVVTDTLRMALIPGGEPLPENTLPSGSSQVYVVFDYQDCNDQLVRVQVYWLDRVPPELIDPFTQVEVLNGSGTRSFMLPAWEYFPEGVFPIGQYTTVLQVPPDEAPNSGWAPVSTASWYVSTRPNDPWYLSPSNYQWTLHNTGYWGISDADIDAPEAWDVTVGWDGIVVAVIGTGVALDHVELVNRIWVNEDEIPGNGQDDDGNGYVDDVQGYDFADDDPDPTDHFGYGTFAAGIIAAETNNEVGIAGVAWNARLMPVKVTRTFRTPEGAPYPGGYMADLIEGLRYAVDNGARVIYSAPVVWTDDPEKIGALEQAIQYVVERGGLVIAPTGDDGKDWCRYPACFRDVLSVGASDPRDGLWERSNWGPYMDLVAPGVLILSICEPGLPLRCPTYGVVRYDQTAWAAAHVAGAAALVWSVNPDRTPQQVWEVLERSADDLGAPGKDDRFGYGRLNVGQAVRETPHKLMLQPSELRFIVHDDMAQVCQTLSNPAMGPFAWGAQTNVNWLTVKGPLGPFTPSQIEVCVRPSALPEYTVYEAPLTVFSRIDPGATVSVPVLVNYMHRAELEWLFLPLLIHNTSPRP
jgi:subtilisin family serine protease